MCALSRSGLRMICSPISGSIVSFRLIIISWSIATRISPELGQSSRQKACLRVLPSSTHEEENHDQPRAALGVSQKWGAELIVRLPDMRIWLQAHPHINGSSSFNWFKYSHCCHHRASLNGVSTKLLYMVDHAKRLASPIRRRELSKRPATVPRS